MKQNRLKSWATWSGFIGAIWEALNAFGLPEQWGLTDVKWNAAVHLLAIFLIGFGILNNPTDSENF